MSLSEPGFSSSVQTILLQPPVGSSALRDQFPVKLGFQHISSDDASSQEVLKTTR